MNCSKCIHFKRCLHLGTLLRDGMIEEAESFCGDFEVKTDVIEVIRCKDCEHWQDKNSKGTQGVCLCGEKDMNYGGEFYPFANDYCSYGERKEGE